MMMIFPAKEQVSKTRARIFIQVRTIALAEHLDAPAAGLVYWSSTPNGAIASFSSVTACQMKVEPLEF